ncbi:MAG TPA: immunoglobulin domain-containing protein [Opitutaceae bacterium]|nr:immunoglobulin domain-containing protein [Opitutaceae bacterium]
MHPNEAGLFRVPQYQVINRRPWRRRYFPGRLMKPAVLFLCSIAFTGVARAQYSGRYTGTYTGSESGTWYIEIYNSSMLAGYATAYGDVPNYMSGTISGNGAFTAAMGTVSTGATFTGQINANGAVSGTWVNVLYANYRGTLTGQRDTAPDVAMAEAIDLPNATVGWSGTLPWRGQSTTTHDGSDAAKSGIITDSQSSAFSVTASGPGTVSFWWKVSSEAGYDYLSFYIDGILQSGQISGNVDWQQKTYTLTSGSHTLKWIYAKDISYSVGSDCGWVDQVVIAGPTPPTITTQPANQAVNVGASATFSVVAAGATPFTYQWKLNGTAITGATGTSYTVPNVQAGNMGFYYVTVSNSGGSVDSAVGILTVNAGHSRLTALSTRGYVPAGGSLTPGFYLRGSGTKGVIVRGVGPSLSNYGVTAPLSDPKMDLIPAGLTTSLLTNDDWGTNSSLPALRAAMPFPLAEGSKDAAALITLLTATNYGYTVRIVPSGTATSGIAMAEVYDLDPTSAPVQFYSLSTLGYTAPGDNVLTPGFIITGDGPKQLLIRAVGPTLGPAPYNVPGVLADPQFRVVPLGKDFEVAGNDNWGGTVALQTAFTQTHDFDLPTNSRDAAAIVRLPPGGYTIQASGVGGTSGNVLVEIYDMDP